MAWGTPLSPDPEDLGVQFGADAAAANTDTVNTLTGDVELSLPVASMAAFGDGSFDLEISYTSRGLEQQVGSWNVAGPTGVLGLGWSLPRQRIVRQSQGTGNSEDDRYFLAEDGLLELVRTGREGSDDIYEPLQHRPWQIRYRQSEERWTLVREDGSITIYGGDRSTGPAGAGSQGDSVEWGVKWDNWIGPSRRTQGQQQFAVAWNLSSIFNPWGEHLSFEYTQEREAVGQDGLPFTKAAYLQSIVHRSEAPNTNPPIRDGGAHHTRPPLEGLPGPTTRRSEMVFSYELKESQEFQDPHTEHAEPDAYQERFERRFLTSIVVSDVDGTLSSTRFIYRSLGSGALQKRLLTAVEYRVDEQPLPGASFGYYGEIEQDGVSFEPSRVLNPDVGALLGALSYINLPTGGTVSYRYGESLGSDRKLDVPLPSDADHPQVHFGPDYAVVTWWVQQVVLHTKVFHWQGEWIEADLSRSTALVDPAHAHRKRSVVTSADAFAVAAPGSLSAIEIFRKDTRRIGQWLHYRWAVPSSSHLKVVAGSNFFAALDTASGKLHRLHWDGTSWQAAADVALPAGRFDIAAGSHWVFTASLPEDRSKDVDLRLFHLDELGAWSTLHETRHHFFRDSVGSGATVDHRRLRIHAGATFVALEASYAWHEIPFLAPSPLYTYAATYRTFGWPENFSVLHEKVLHELNTPTVEPDHVAMNVAGNTVLAAWSNDDGVLAAATGTPQPDPLKVAAHFDGRDWHVNTFHNDTLNKNYVGYDTFSTTVDGSARIHELDPGRGTWKTVLPAYLDGNPTLFEKVWKYVELAELMVAIVTAPIGGELGLIIDLADTAFSIADLAVSAGFDVQGTSTRRAGTFFMADENVYHRDFSGQWHKRGDLTDVFSQRFEHDTWNNHFDSRSVHGPSLDYGIHFVSFAVENETTDCPVGLQGNCIEGSTFTSFVRPIKNGALGEAELLAGSVKKSSGETLSGPGMLAAYSGGDSLSKARALHLYRISDGEVAGPLRDHVVQRVAVDSGRELSFTHYHYDSGRAVFAADGSTAFYPRATVVPSGASPTENPSRPYGFVEFHALSSRSAGPAGLVEDTHVKDCTGSTCVDGKDLSVADGLPFATRVFSSEDGRAVEVAVLRSEYSVKAYGVGSGPGRTPRGSALAVERDTVENHLDGVFQSYSFQTDAKGLPKSVISEHYKPDGSIEFLQKESLYAHLYLPDMAAQNQLTAVAGTIETQGESRERTFVTWMDWRDVSAYSKWAPRESYVSTGPTTDSDPLTDPENWLRVDTVLHRHRLTGKVQERGDVDGVVSSTLLDRWGRLAVAEFVHAGVTSHEAGYYGFEAYEPGLGLRVQGSASSPGHTGAAALGGSFPSVAPYAFQPRGGGAVPYSAAARFRPAAGQTCTLSFGSSVRQTEPGRTDWQYLEIVVEQPNGHQPPEARCSGHGRIDDFRFGPVDAPFEATVYNRREQPVAKIGQNGEVTRFAYDSLSRPRAVIGPGDALRFVQIHGSDAATHRVLKVDAREGGSYFPFQGEDLSGWSLSRATIGNSELRVAGGGHARIEGLSGAGDWAIAMTVAPPNEPHLQVPPGGLGGDPSGYPVPEADRCARGGVAVGTWAVEVDCRGRFELLHGATSVAEGHSDGTHNSWLWVAVDGRLTFYHGGKHVLSAAYDGSIEGPLALYLPEFSEASHFGVLDLAVVRAPMLTAEYFDGLGRARQVQQLESGEMSIVAETLYDELGRPAMWTKPVRVPGAPKYRPQFAASGAGGVMTGEIASLVPEAQGFPYQGLRFESSPLSRTVESALPGRAFAMGGERTMRFAYGSDPVGHAWLRNMGLEVGRFKVETAYRPETGGRRIPQTVAFDGLGQRVLEAHGEPSTSHKSIPQGLDRPHDERFGPGSAPRGIVALFQTDHLSTGSSTHITPPNALVSHSGSTASSGLPTGALGGTQPLGHHGHPTHPQNPSGTWADIDRRQAMQTGLDFDDLGRLRRRTSPDRGQSHFFYDRAGRLRLEVDGALDSPAGGHLRANYWKYDPLGRLLESGYVDLTVPASLELLAQTQPDWPSGADPSVRVVWRSRYVYDFDAEHRGPWSGGRLLKVLSNNNETPDADGEERYEYDLEGRIVAVHNTFWDDTFRDDAYGDDTYGDVTLRDSGDALSYSTAYQYDAWGQITRIDYPSLPGEDRLTVVYGHDPLGRVVSIGRIVSGGTELVDAFARYTYHADGRPAEEILNASEPQHQARRSFEHNPAGFLTAIRDHTFFTEQLAYVDAEGAYQGGKIARLSFDFRPERFTGSTPQSHAFDFTYDDPGRLTRSTYTSASSSEEREFSYDANGNVTAALVKNRMTPAPPQALDDGTVVYSNPRESARAYPLLYAPNSNRLAIADGRSFSYDVAGYVTSASQGSHQPGAFRFDIDPSRRKAQAIYLPLGDRVSFQYGVGELRVRKTVVSAQGRLERDVVSVHGLSLEPLTQSTLGPDGTRRQAFYVYGPTGLIAVSDASRGDVFVAKDHLGSTRVLFDRSLRPLAFYSYTAFGAPITDNSDVHGSDIPFLYTGREFDVETGLYDFHARLYDPEVARFYGPDPAGESFSPYTYVGNDPISFVDPTGTVRTITRTKTHLIVSIVTQATSRTSKYPLSLIEEIWKASRQNKKNLTFFAKAKLAQTASGARVRMRKIAKFPLPFVDFTRHIRRAPHATSAFNGRWVRKPSLAKGGAMTVTVVYRKGVRRSNHFNEAWKAFGVSGKNKLKRFYVWDHRGRSFRITKYKKVGNKKIPIEGESEMDLVPRPVHNVVDGGQCHTGACAEANAAIPGLGMH